MSLPVDLLAEARRLATRDRRLPRQTRLRRSVSAAYYAVFHLLVDAACRPAAPAGFDPAAMRRVARQFAERDPSPRLGPGLEGLPLQDGLVRTAATFVDLQQHGHDADYDTGRRFTCSETLYLVGPADLVFVDWREVRNSPQADTFLVGLLTFR